MTRLKLLFCRCNPVRAWATAPILAQAADLPVTPSRLFRSPYPISYNHNYGPGPLPGTFAYYDGPLDQCLSPECCDLSRPGPPQVPPASDR